MKYEELPVEIQRIVPKNKFSSAHKCQNGDIILWITYDNISDRWVKVDGKYQLSNPESK